MKSQAAEALRKLMRQYCKTPGDEGFKAAMRLSKLGPDPEAEEILNNIRQNGATLELRIMAAAILGMFSTPERVKKASETLQSAALQKNDQNLPELRLLAVWQLGVIGEMETLGLLAGDAKIGRMVQIAAIKSLERLGQVDAAAQYWILLAQQKGGDATLADRVEAALAAGYLEHPRARQVLLTLGRKVTAETARECYQAADALYYLGYYADALSLYLNLAAAWHGNAEIAKAARAALRRRPLEG